MPCTPLGCLMLLKDRLGDLSGLEAVVVGRSNIVGKPMAQLLLQRELHRHRSPTAAPATCPTSSAAPTSSSPRSAGRKWSRATG